MSFILLAIAQTQTHNDIIAHTIPIIWNVPFSDKSVKTITKGIIKQITINISIAIEYLQPLSIELLTFLI